jgi:hypothetical protein
MSDPQAADWGGLHWSTWHDFDEAHYCGLIPTTPGLYRFRAQDEPGMLLYLGESGRKGKGRQGRLNALARGRNRHPPSYYLDWRANGLSERPHRGHYSAPYFRMCEDAGCHVEVSWALEEHPDKTERKAVEEQLIRLHQETTGVEPPIQHGGRGVSAYLEKRRARVGNIPRLSLGDNGMRSAQHLYDMAQSATGHIRAAAS